MRTRALAFCGALLAILAASGQSPAGVKRGPLLLRDEQGRLFVAWESDRPERSALVLRSAAAQEGTTSSDSAKRRFHLHPFPDLPAGGSCTYALVSGGLSHGPWTFRTPGAGALRVAVLGAPTARPDVLLALAGRALDLEPHVLLFACGLHGVLGQEGREADLLGAAGPLFARVPLLRPARSTEVSRTLLGPPPARPWTLFRLGPWRLLVAAPTADAESLRKALPPAEGDAPCAAVLPRPLFWSGPAGSDWSARRSLFPALAERALPLVLSAFEGGFERTRPLRQRQGGPCQVHVASAGAAAVLARLPDSYWSAARGGFHHVLLLALEEGRAVLTAVDSQGLVRDRAVVTDRGSVPGETPVLRMSLSLGEDGREGMRRMERAAADLARGLAGDEPLGLLALAVRLEEEAGRLAGGAEERLASAAKPLLAAARDAAGSDFQRPDGRMLAEEHLARARRACVRCHSLYR